MNLWFGSGWVGFGFPSLPHITLWARWRLALTTWPRLGPCDFVDISTEEHTKEVSLLGFQKEKIPGRDRVAFWEGEGGAEEVMVLLRG